MQDNLSNLKGSAIFFNSHLEKGFLDSLESMYKNQSPSCIVIKGYPVTNDLRPENLEIETTSPEQSGEKFSKEILRLLEERLGHSIKSHIGNVIRTADINNPKYIKVEPTHTHPSERINNMFCNIEDGVISKVIFIENVWRQLNTHQKEKLQELGVIDFEQDQILWNKDFVDTNDIYEKLEALQELKEEKIYRELSHCLKENEREYYLRAGEMIFFAQLKTLRGAEAYLAPASGSEKRWYQSLTLA